MLILKGKIQHYMACLLIVAFLVTVISFSRYAKTVAVGNEARVARVVFEYVPVSATFNGVPVPSLEEGIEISGALPGDVLIYHFDIKNYDGTINNQVLMKYKIDIIFNPDPAILPLTYELEPASSYQSAGSGWTILGFDGEETHSYTLTVTWDDAEYSPDYLNETQAMQIQINAEQIDS